MSIVLLSFRRALVMASVAFVAACGGGSADAPPPTENGTPVAPQITQQPSDVAIDVGATATFSVTASGTAPLMYQWQRNGAPIDGATAASYTISAVALTDGGAMFSVVVSNAGGSGASRDALLVVNTPVPPVLTITLQPADTTVAAGSQASFGVDGTCSAGALAVQWQRLNGAIFADIAGATATTLTQAPGIGDDGAQFRALLSCSGQSPANSATATLHVTAAPSGGVLSLVPINGLREQAPILLTRGIVREPAGSYAFISENTVRRLSADLLSITLIAGTPGTAATLDGLGAAAQFNFPSGITVDSTGNLYVTELNGQVIRRIAIDGTVSTLAGAAGVAGTADGTGSAARFSTPTAIAMGPDGDLYVTEAMSSRVRRVTTAGVVSVYAGDSTGGYVDSAPATARFASPRGIAVAPDGTVYVGDTGNSRVRRIARNGSAAGTVDTLAGSGSALSSVDGTGIGAGVRAPRDMSLRGNTLYVRDADGLVRAIDITNGAVSTFAGTRGGPPFGYIVGYEDGPVGTALLDADTGGVAATADGRLIVTDATVGAVRLVATDGSVSTIAVPDPYAVPPDLNGIGVLVQEPINFDPPRAAITAGTAGSIYVGTTSTIRRIGPDGTVTPVVGLVGIRRNLDGIGSVANLDAAAAGMATAPDGRVVFFDASNVRVVDPATRTVVALAGGTDATSTGALDGTGAAARFNGVEGLTVTPNGDIYAADANNNAIRRITPTGVVTTFSGVMGQSGTSDGAAATARYTRPRLIASAPDGTFWVIDDTGSGSALRHVGVDGSVSTLIAAGPMSAALLAVDPMGRVYVGLPDGLYQVDTSTGALTNLIPAGASLQLGSSPQLPLASFQRLIATGSKQLVMVVASRLLRANLP